MEVRIFSNESVLQNVREGNTQFEVQKRQGNNPPELRRNLILKTLISEGFMVEGVAAAENLDAMLEIHDHGFVKFVASIWNQWAKAGKPKSFLLDDGHEGGVVPFVFTKTKNPRQNSWQAELACYVLDYETPIFSDTFEALCADVGIVQSAANSLLQSPRRANYAVITHPGHHSGPNYASGFCILNQAFLAATIISSKLKTGIIDVDYHGGNGTYDLIMRAQRQGLIGSGIEFVSLHCEKNYPWVDMGRFGRDLKPGITWNQYEAILRHILQSWSHLDALVISLGFDTLASDPESGKRGTEFGLTVKDFESMGRLLASTGKRLLFVQEGGYDLENVPKAAAALMTGISKARFAKL